MASGIELPGEKWGSWCEKETPGKAPKEKAAHGVHDPPLTFAEPGGPGTPSAASVRESLSRSVAVRRRTRPTRANTA